MVRNRRQRRIAVNKQTGMVRVTVMERYATTVRQTTETQVEVAILIDGRGKAEVSSGIPFFDHMLSLFAKHGFFDLTIRAQGDLEVDFHHTVEDVGLVLGETITKALGDRSGIRRYGYAVTPMDDALAAAAVDLSNRPFLVLNAPEALPRETGFGIALSREFFRALVNNCGMNLHINVAYGDNEHHVLEAMFKSLARALDAATGFDERIQGPMSTKGCF